MLPDTEARAPQRKNAQRPLLPTAAERTGRQTPHSAKASVRAILDHLERALRRELRRRATRCA